MSKPLSLTGDLNLQKKKSFCKVHYTAFIRSVLVVAITDLLEKRKKKKKII